MSESHNTAKAEAEAEAQANVDKDRDNREDYGLGAGGPEVRANSRSDDIAALDGKLGGRKLAGILEELRDLGLGIAVADARLDGKDACITLAGSGLDESGVVKALDSLADIAHIDIALDGVDNRRTAREVDGKNARGVRNHPVGEKTNRCYDNQCGSNHRRTRILHEIDIGVLEELRHLEGSRALGIDRVVKDKARNDNCREHGDHDTAYEHDRKSANGTGTHHVEDDAREDCGDVGVENGGERLAVACADGASGLDAAGKLFTNALVDDDVRIDSHAERENEAGDAGHRENRKLNAALSHF